MANNVERAPRVRVLFAYPFRIFFLSAAVWAFVVVPLWLAVLLGPHAPPLALPPLAWHQHEMVFALLNAAIAGFLLTAVGTWTNTQALHGGRLLGLWAIWALGRLFMLGGAALPGWLATLPDLMFLPLVMLDAGSRILAARQSRQVPVLAVLLLIWLLQLAFHFRPGVSLAPTALLAAMALMMIIGGRITPAFSTNWLRMRGRAPLPNGWPWLDGASIATLILLVPMLIWVPGIETAGLAVVAALLTAWRIGRWQGWRVAQEPLLWILHLSLLWIPAALLLLAGSVLGWWPRTVWLHAAGMGAMANLILGVMARVALGHTGRPLQLSRGIAGAFVALQLAALARVLTAFGAVAWRWGLLLSAALWMVAFGLYLWRYSGILMRPRPDGRPG